MDQPTSLEINPAERRLLGKHPRHNRFGGHMGWFEFVRVRYPDDGNVMFQIVAIIQGKHPIVMNLRPDAVAVLKQAIRAFEAAE